MASLLVSVRSATEARAALDGGAAVIDVKEPDRGPLGRADYQVWAEVRRAVPPGTPVSVALGELGEYVAPDAAARSYAAVATDPVHFRGFSFRKMGLSGAGHSWRDAWARLRDLWGAGPSWVAVLYADWEKAFAPRPELVLDVALGDDDCAGVLIDTWDKNAPPPPDLHSWGRWLGDARASGRLTALAGSLDLASIERYAALRPDIVAVRGAACVGGNRLAPVDPARVAQLARAAAFV